MICRFKCLDSTPIEKFKCLELASRVIALKTIAHNFINEIYNWILENFEIIFSLRFEYFFDK